MSEATSDSDKCHEVKNTEWCEGEWLTGLLQTGYCGETSISRWHRSWTEWHWGESHAKVWGKSVPGKEKKM